MMTDERKCAIALLTGFAYPTILADELGYIPKFQFKSRVMKKAIREVRKTGDTSMVVFAKRARGGKGDVIYLAVYDHPVGTKRTAFTEGVILYRGLKEIPFKNILESNAAIQTAYAIHHYEMSFKEYDCSAGI